MKLHEKFQIYLVGVSSGRERQPTKVGEKSEKFAKNNSKYVDYKIFKNTKHEPHNDTAQIKVFKYTLDWLTKNILKKRCLKIISNEIE